MIELEIYLVTQFRQSVGYDYESRLHSKEEQSLRTTKIGG